MKKALAGLLSLLVLAPAIMIACRCCPLTQQDGTVRIQKVACHGCCPGALKIVRDSAAREEKPLFQTPQGKMAVLPGLAIYSYLPLQDANNFFLFETPPRSSPGLSLVLRI